MRGWNIGSALRIGGPERHTRSRGGAAASFWRLPHDQSPGLVLRSCPRSLVPPCARPDHRQQVGAAAATKSPLLSPIAVGLRAPCGRSCEPLGDGSARRGDGGAGSLRHNHGRSHVDILNRGGTQKAQMPSQSLVNGTVFRARLCSRPRLHGPAGQHIDPFWVQSGPRAHETVLNEPFAVWSASSSAGQISTT